MARTKAISLIQSGSTKVDLAELSGLVISNIQKDTLSQGLKSQAYKAPLRSQRKGVRRAS